MKTVIADVLKIVTPLSVATIVFAEALGISPGQVASFFKDRPGLMLRSLVAAIVVVPAAALALVLLLRPERAVGVGLAIMVACPPAPLMFSSAPKKGGASAAFMASLDLSLAALAFLTVPAVLYSLSLAVGFHADVNLGSMAWTLARTLLLPIGLGLTVRGLFPGFADAWGAMLGKAGILGLLVVILFALIAVFPALAAMDTRSYLVMASVSLAALATGHLLGRPDPHERTTLAVECGVRHPGLAIAIGSANFGSQRALPVLIPCAITFMAIATVYLSMRGRGLDAKGSPS
jgi:bile acid:Na+ symporter, BASS family